MHILSVLIFLPLLAAAIIAAMPAQYERYYKWICLIVSGLCFFGSVHAAVSFAPQYEHLQYEENLPWMQFAFGNLGVFKINYHLGVDGLNIGLLVLATLVQLVASISSFEINHKAKGYFATFLLLSSSIIGCFVAQDFFLFFLFFEFMLLPMYFLIGIWGGKNREYASIKFFIYTLVGSIFILLVMIGLFVSTGNPADTAMLQNNLTHYSQISNQLYLDTQASFAVNNVAEATIVKTLDFSYLSDSYNVLGNSLLSVKNANIYWGLTFREWAFLLLFLGFAIKLPLVPFHTWLPDAHVEAPTAVSVILAGTLLKVGGYGFIRIAYHIFPDVAGHFAFYIALFGVISIIWGALNALAQTDLKRLVAYSSVSHMGFVVLAVAAFTVAGYNAAIYQMLSHGLLSAMLFLLVGVLYVRTGSRKIADYQGLAQAMPAYTVMVAVAFFASLGLPMFSGFIGEFFSILSAISTPAYPAYMGYWAGLGIVLGAAYFLHTFKKMWLGSFWQAAGHSLADLSLREKIMLYFLAITTLLIGVYPRLVYDLSSFTVSNLPYFK
jgi:NADH-quinone oxidoreductase subunit M